MGTLVGGWGRKREKLGFMEKERVGLLGFAGKLKNTINFGVGSISVSFECVRATALRVSLTRYGTRVVFVRT